MLKNPRKEVRNDRQKLLKGLRNSLGLSLRTVFAGFDCYVNNLQPEFGVQHFRWDHVFTIYEVLQRSFKCLVMSHIHM